MHFENDTQSRIRIILGEFDTFMNAEVARHIQRNTKGTRAKNNVKERKRITNSTIATDNMLS